MPLPRNLLAGAAALSMAFAAIPAAAQISGDVVKIGVLTDMTSLYADINGMGAVEAAKMAIEDFGGIVLGKKIELVFADTQNKPDVGLTVGGRWFDVDGVDVIVGASSSAVSLAINSLAASKNKVFVAPDPASSDFTGKSCNATTVHWTYDTYALANGTGAAVVQAGGDSWYFLTADYAFGYALERDVSAVVTKSGGKVLGSVRHPLNTSDFSSFILQAQASKAKVVGFANAGGDTINSIKQAAEFGVVQGGQKLAGLLVFISDIHSLGLQAAQGLQLTSAYYWDRNDESRAFGKRWGDRFKNRRPTMVQAGFYAGVLHYLKAVKALGSDGPGDTVVAKMKELPTDDPLFGKGSIRIDGRKMHDMYLFEVKKPSESKGPWDYYKLIRTIPAKEAFRPLEQGGCKLVKN
jgi:branched-chain amino acid transport system substrate-binding protein